tara:strand:+ start:681 stop:914 length:234 start_codon:yes stop_codon:yes gene_type:complete
MNIENLPDNTIILEPQNIYNHAIIKYDGVLYYSLDKLVDSFSEHTDLSYGEIIEHLEYNTWGYTPHDWPILIDDLNE